MRFSPVPIVALYCYRAHRDLHSFPTRRSSDLGKIHYFGKWARRVNGKFVRVEGDGWEEALALYKAVDRKSTRLNSSHLVISYAVFCLKKKRAAKHIRLLLRVRDDRLDHGL